MQSALAGPLTRLPRELRFFLKVLFTLIFCSLLDAFVRWPLQGAKAAFSALLLSSPFADIDCYWPRFLFLHTPTFFHYPGQLWTYPAPCAFIYKFIYRLSTFTTFREVYLSLGIALLAVAASFFGVCLYRAGLPWKKAFLFSVVVSVFSWPIYFSFERGNIESILWLMLAAGLALYISGRSHLAAVAIGFVAAFKIYPILFVGLFLPARRYREIAEALLTAVMVTLVGLLYLSHNLRYSAQFIRQGVQFFLQNYSARYLIDVNGYDHSAWAFFKAFVKHHAFFIQHTLRAYTPVAGCLALAYYFLVLWKAPRFNRLLAIATLMVLLPATSFDYTLQALYIPFAWLCVATVRAHRRGRTLAGAGAYFLAFALIFAPLVFVRSRTYSINGQLKALVLLALLYLVSRYPMADRDMLPEAETHASAPGPLTATPS